MLVLSISHDTNEVKRAIRTFCIATPILTELEQLWGKHMPAPLTVRAFETKERRGDGAEAVVYMLHACSFGWVQVAVSKKDTQSSHTGVQKLRRCSHIRLHTVRLPCTSCTPPPPPPPDLFTVFKHREICFWLNIAESKLRVKHTEYSNIHFFFLFFLSIESSLRTNQQ